MTKLDPFARGSHPVGVRTLDRVDSERDRKVPIEVWYPADLAHEGADVDPKTRDTYSVFGGLTAPQSAVRDAQPAGGSFPLVVFSHGFAAHRRQSTFFTTHLASHGYVVAAPDHAGNTMADLVARIGGTDGPFDRVADHMRDRPLDMLFALNTVASERDLAPLEVDASRVGIAGHSFGGWTAVTTTARDRRIVACLPLAPAGAVSTIPNNPLRDTLELDWGREVPTLYLVGDRDSLLPLEGMKEMLDLTAAPRRMLVLHDADHFHFCDDASSMHEMFRSLPDSVRALSPPNPMPAFSELCAASHTYAATQGLSLAHFDAWVKNDLQSRDWSREDLAAHLRARGVRATLLE